MIATSTSTEPSLIEAATSLARAIQASVEWKEMVNAQKAGERDARFGQMMARHLELSRIQSHASKQSKGLDGKLLVEFIAVRDQIQSRDLPAPEGGGKRRGAPAPTCEREHL